MALNEQALKYRALDDWFNTPQGHGVALAFAAELATIGESLYGDTLLQLGSCGDNLWLPSLRFRHKWLATPYLDLKKTSVLSSLNALPLDRDSVDCIIAPLTLEAFAHNKNPIDEIDRVLKPMGYVIFFGINPMSFWGYSLRWGQLRCFGQTSATLISSLSLKHAMQIRDYRQCLHSSFYYIPPFKKDNLIRKLSFLNEVGKMVCPFPAGFYCFIVQKYHCANPNFIINTGEEMLLQPSISMKI